MRSASNLLVNARRYAKKNAKQSRWTPIDELPAPPSVEVRQAHADRRKARKAAQKQQARQRAGAKCATLECAPVPLVLKRLTTGDNLAKQAQHAEHVKRIREVKQAREGGAAK